MVIVVPHQDDEIFCYTLLSKAEKLVVVFKGGGEPKGYKLDPEKLYEIRCNETLKTCKEMGIKDVSFLGVQRPYTEVDLNVAIRNVFDRKHFDIVVTTLPIENHPDHVALGKAVSRFCYADELYGFIVHTGTLVDYSNRVKPNEVFELTDEEYAHKIRLADNYETQKHFLPNVIKRSIYKTERYWRLK